METRNRIYPESGTYLEAAKATPEEVQVRKKAVEERKKAAEERKILREVLVEQPEETAQNTVPVAEGNVDNAVAQQVEQKQKRRKAAKSGGETQKSSAAPGGGDMPMDEHAQTLREAQKEIRRLQQQLEERESEWQVADDSRAFFRAGAHPKAQTTLDTTMSTPPKTWTGCNRWAALFFALGVYVDETDDDLIDINY